MNDDFPVIRRKHNTSVRIGPDGIEGVINEDQNVLSILIEGADEMIGEIRLWGDPLKPIVEMTADELFAFSHSGIKSMFGARDVKKLITHADNEAAQIAVKIVQEVVSSPRLAQSVVAEMLKRGLVIFLGRQN